MSCKKCGYGDIRQIVPGKYCEEHFMTPPKDMNKIFVIAGNLHQYQNYLYKNKLNSNKYIYISTVEKIFGTANPKVIKVGTYWENPILDRVEKEVILRNGSFENEKR